MALGVQIFCVDHIRRGLTGIAGHISSTGRDLFRVKQYPSLKYIGRIIFRRRFRHRESHMTIIGIYCIRSTVNRNRSTSGLVGVFNFVKYIDFIQIINIDLPYGINV